MSVTFMESIHIGRSNKRLLENIANQCPSYTTGPPAESL